MKKLYFIPFIFLLTIQCIVLSGQSFYFGPKGGLGLNIQQWNGFQRQPLIVPFGDIFIESYDEESPSSLFAQIGYHTRGSAIRVLNLVGGSFSNSFRFNNLVLAAGAKRVLNVNAPTRPYYLVGIRGEYTLSTNLHEYEQQMSTFYPFDFYVNKFNYGLTAGGGFEFDFQDLVGGFIEITVNPDVSFQYDQPPIPNVRNPFTGNLETLRERRIRNVSLEVTIGLRFLRKVEYY
ncbi:MAG TPA: hypothetical protein PKC30_05395 [Saprospiraceae bacterium]|nr:hypothetical protein [Saprospiraceae bacterium]